MASAAPSKTLSRPPAMPRLVTIDDDLDLPTKQHHQTLAAWRKLHCLTAAAVGDIERDVLGVLTGP